MRERYDPREHLKAVEVRAASAVDAATRMAGDIAAGALDPFKPGFHQGNLGSGPAADLPPAAEQPADEAGAEPAALPAAPAVAVNGAERKVCRRSYQGFLNWGLFIVRGLESDEASA